MKSASKVQVDSISLSKVDPRFWLRPGKLKKWGRSPYYSFQLQFKGMRTAFSTRSGNRETAARIAAGIYRDLVALGPEEAMAKHKPERKPPESVATVGDWIEGARGVMSVSETTFHSYATSLRQIVADIVEVRRTAKRFGPHKGGAKAFRQQVDRASLAVLDPRSIQKWRLDYVGRAKTPKEKLSKMTSCNSLIRMARSLFSPKKVIQYLPGLKLPDPTPFYGVEFFDGQRTEYVSRIDARALLKQGEKDLRHADPPAFVVLLLALGAGLRRGEIDGLTWDQIDFRQNLVRVEATNTSGIKTAHSRGSVPIDSQLAKVLKTFKKKGVNGFVVPGEAEKDAPKTWGIHYRAEPVYQRLMAWLRSQGISARKPLHELRKELGALVTTEFGIYAASRVLRHASVSTTSRHYADLKERPVVPIGSWLSS
jgi:integrase